MQVLLQRAQIWWAQVPYNNDAAMAKPRPVVIIGYSSFAKGEDHNVLVVPSYTFNGDSSKALVGDIKLTDRVPGMDASFIRTRRLMSLHPNQILWSRGLIGSATKRDWDAMITEIEKLFSGPQTVGVPGAFTA
jgi:hypothetical protein